MAPWLTRRMRKWLAQAGLELTRASVHSSARLRLIKLLEVHRIGLVIDVGANEGQYGSYLREIGYRGQIVSFEPMARAHEVLAARARSDLDWKVAQRCAIGESRRTVELQVAGNSASSSLLEMLPLHERAAPGTGTVAREEVPMLPLEIAAEPFLQTPPGKVLLKIDVQGYEPQVLAGAASILPRIEGLQVELSFAELYRGQVLWLEMIDRLAGFGFECHGIDSAFSDPGTGRQLQADGLFFRTAHA